MTRCEFESEQAKCDKYYPKSDANLMCDYFRPDFLGPGEGICDGEYQLRAVADDEQE